MMAVNRKQHFSFRRPSALGLLVILFSAGSAATAQAPNPTSAANPFFGSVTAQARSDETLKLSLDDAVARGLKNNLGLKEAESDELQVRGEKNEAIQMFLPTITLKGDTGIYQHNLAAQGFGPSVISKFAGLFPGGTMPKISLITKDDLTDGQVQFGEMLFSGPVIGAFKAASAAEKAAHFAKMTARGEVVQQVATAYLHAIAAQSEVDNAQALVSQAQVLFDHAHQSHVAGVAANIDELRAQRAVAGTAAGADLRTECADQRPDPAEARDRDRSRPEHCTDRCSTVQRSRRADAGRGARGGLQESAGLPEPAEPDRGLQGAAPDREDRNDCRA